MLRQNWNLLSTSCMHVYRMEVTGNPELYDFDDDDILNPLFVSIIGHLIRYLLAFT